MYVIRSRTPRLHIAAGVLILLASFPAHILLYLTLFYIYLLLSDKAPTGNPFRQGKKGEKLTSFKTAMVAHNADGNGNFFKLTYMPSGYLTSVNYAKTQPVDQRKLGFGTKDAFKSDEFTNAIRTQQHRESIVKEMTRAKEGMEERTEAILSKYAKPESESEDRKVAQYDIGRNRVTPFDPKSKSDTYYKFDDSKGKRMGMYRPVSTEFGASAWTTKYAPPANGGRSEVSKFYDNSHLTVDRTAL